MSEWFYSGCLGIHLKLILTPISYVILTSYLAMALYSTRNLNNNYFSKFISMYAHDDWNSSYILYIENILTLLQLKHSYSVIVGLILVKKKLSINSWSSESMGIVSIVSGYQGAWNSS